MNDKKIFKDIRSDFCNFIDSCSHYGFYTRAIDLQRKKVLDCENYLEVIKQYKYQAIGRENEYEANQLFHMQCMINALRSYLFMWIQLKEGEFQKSWTSLVDVQEYTAIALKTNDYEGVRIFEARLISAEKSLFPNWNRYNSCGFIETIGECSICHNLFFDCEHIENAIYMGSLCERINRKVVEINHVALVENPRDRRCIFTNISDDDGNEIDNFTLEKTGNKVDNNDGYHCKATLFYFSRLDVS
ncbi:hypothetical protein [Psychrobacter urativorans]|uniref:hypothetical protein n=1 Tax=Psychrobacter urativorans TaxID=45610 RepID=UPI001919A417|nr:hypothetical protein [Psychrobacter urativorans]